MSMRFIEQGNGTTRFSLKLKQVRALEYLKDAVDKTFVYGKSQVIKGTPKDTGTTARKWSIYSKKRSPLIAEIANRDTPAWRTGNLIEHLDETWKYKPFQKKPGRPRAKPTRGTVMFWSKSKENIRSRFKVEVNKAIDKVKDKLT